MHRDWYLWTGHWKRRITEVMSVQNRTDLGKRGPGHGNAGRAKSWKSALYHGSFQFNGFLSSVIPLPQFYMQEKGHGIHPSPSITAILRSKEAHSLTVFIQ